MAEAYAAFKRETFARREVEQRLQGFGRRPVAIPADLEARIRAYLAGHPEQTWDEAVRRIVEESDADP
jgi:hypothetical protein